MDKVPVNSIDQEKITFIARLKYNPVFLLQHLPVLTQIIYVRFRNKYLQKISAPHRAGKKRPKWMSFTSKQKTSNNIEAVLPTLPFRSTPSTTLNPIEIKLHADDLEHYLAKHRWFQLFTNLLRNDKHLPEEIKQWLVMPPAKSDPAWETYSTCERIANLVNWLLFIDPATRRKLFSHPLQKFMRDSTEWVATHLEYYADHTGNHILNNARALIMGGYILKDDAYIELGMKVLSIMLPKIVLAAGVLREGSSHYQLIVFGWLLDAYVFLKLGHHALFAENFLLPIILKMQGVCAALCDPSGELQAYIGDISPDASPELTVLRLKHCHPEFWPAKGAQISYQHYANWHILQHENQKLIVNSTTETTFPNTFSSHAHNDFLSCIWITANQPILIDCGRTHYLKDDIANVQKSANGHNTLLVNNLPPLCESIVVNGHWYPTPYAKAQIVTHFDNHVLRISHDGFKRATPVVHHQRVFKLSTKQLIIEDSLDGKGSVTLQWFWHLQPGFKSITSYLFQHKHFQLEILLKNIKANQVQLIEQHEMLGWHATQYGEKKQHLVISIQQTVKLPFHQQTIFRIKPCVA